MSTYRTAAEWQGLVTEWRASGVPRGAFARAKGVNARTLSWWAWRLQAPRPGRAVPAFAEVVVAEPVRPPVVGFVVEVGVARVTVPCGFDAGELRRLVAALC